jgi:hypothetical protein
MASNVITSLVGKPKGQNYYEDLGVAGSTNFKVTLKEIRCDVKST